MVSLPPQLLQTSACKPLRPSARDFFNGVMNTAAIVEPSSSANVFLALTALLTAPRSALCWAAKLKRFRERVEVVRNVSTNVSTAFHIGLSENRCGGPQPPSPFGRGLGVRRYGADLSKKCAPANRRDIVCQEFGLRRQAAQSKQSFLKIERRWPHRARAGRKPASKAN
jgi:hypothetical protein